MKSGADISTPSYGEKTMRRHKCGTKAMKMRQEASAQVDVLNAHGFAVVIDPAFMNCNTYWVPHPCDVLVFVARVGEHDAKLLARINYQGLRREQGASAP
jgi:hypothetical protein